MYEVDGKDVVRELTGVPQSSVGAPIPLVISDEHRVVLAYYLEENDANEDDQTVRVVGADDTPEPLAMVRFSLCYAHMLGPPNDEAFSGHPLAARGLGPYGAYEIENSS